MGATLAPVHTALLFATIALVTPLALLWLAAVFSVLCLSRAPELDDDNTVERIVERCQGSSGWTLVSRAQREVHEAMPDYAFCNGFDTPRLALARRRGICWHRAFILRAVLDARGVRSRVVHAFVNEFDDGLVSGHVWLEVTLDGETLPVCAGAADNAPGALRFRSRSKVRAFGPAMLALTWAGAPIANVFAALVTLARGGSIAPATKNRRPLVERVPRSALWPIVPLLAFNAWFASRLPPLFSDDRAVPAVVLVAEAIGRGFVFVAPAFITLGLATRWQRRGLALFAFGSVVYTLSWLPLLSASSPAWWWWLPYGLPSLWLLGLGLMGRSGAYIAGATLFALAHGTHGLFALAAAR